MRDKMKNERGTAMIEYFVVGLVVLLATLAFFDQGNFLGARQSVEQSFDTVVNQMVAP